MSKLLRHTSLCLTLALVPSCGLWHTLHPRIDKERAPKIVEFIPADDAVMVPADLQEMIVRFDRSMHSGFSLRFHGPNPLTEEPYWRDPTELVIPIRLQTGAQYTIDLNDPEHFSFIDRQGFALLPTRWQFTTATE